MSDIAQTPPFPITIHAPTGDTWLSRPVWVLRQFLLFHRKGMLYAYRTDGTLRWSIKAQIAIMGFAMGDDDGDSLYVQDGHVLCEYPLDSLQKVVVKMPSNALAFGQNGPKSWSVDDGDDETSFKALFEGAPATDTYSAPLYFTESGESKVYVLRSDGKVFAAHPDLTPARVPHAGDTGNIPDVPDQPGEPPQPALYLDSSNGPARLCFISGGQAVVLPDNRLEPHPEGIDVWRQNCLLKMTKQPWMPLASPAQGFIGGGSAGSQAAAVTLFDSTAGGWSFHLVDPRCAPALSSAGSMQVQDVTSSATVTHANPGIPARLVISTPQCHEWSGVLPVVEVLSAPYLLEEDGARFVYVIATIASGRSNVPALCKFKLVALDRNASPATPSDTYVLRWWKAVQCAHDTLQPILASEIVLTLTDQTQQAITNGTLPGTFAKTSYSSPLWSATLQGSVPWDKFAPATPVYVPLSNATPGTIVTPVDASIPQSIMQSLNVTSRPSAPLFGPRAVPDGTTNYFVLSNRWGLWGFGPDGALAWRIPARIGFQGWIPAGKFLLVTEGEVLSAYDTSHFPNDGSAVLYPDQWIDLASVTQSVMTGSNQAFDNLILGRGTGWPPVAQTYPPDSYVPYQTDPNTIHLHTQWGPQNDLAIGFDPSGGLISGSGNLNSPFVSGPGLQTDLTVDAPRVNWRPASAALPASVGLLPGDGDQYADELERAVIVGAMAPPQMSTTAEPIDICGNVFWVETSDFGAAPGGQLTAAGFLYCCLARGPQYSFVRFPVLLHPLD